LHGQANAWANRALSALRQRFFFEKGQLRLPFRLTETALSGASRF